MNEIRYEVNWHQKGGEEFFSVTQIKVIWEGVLPGCSLPTITAIGSDGRRFQGNPNDYFKTKEEAQEYIRESLRLSILNIEIAMRLSQKKLESYKKLLEDLK